MSGGEAGKQGSREAGLLVLMLLLTLAGCSNPFGREYEYEEELYLAVDGSATVVVNASIAALTALRGLSIDPSTSARFDAAGVRTLYESMGCQVLRVGRPWYRHGRRFIQVRIASADVTALGRCAPLGWSTYSFTRSNGAIDFKQRVGPPTGRDPGAVNWTGSRTCRH